jgi:hypothetical protein
MRRNLQVNHTLSDELTALAAARPLQARLESTMAGFMAGSGLVSPPTVWLQWLDGARRCRDRRREGRRGETCGRSRVG